MNINFYENFYWPLQNNKNIDIIKSIFGENKNGNIFLVSSKSAAFNIVFSFYNKNRKIKTKNSEILVSEYLKNDFYNTLQKICFPTTLFSDQIKGIVVNHQYGFPQNLDSIIPLAREKHWFVIEDCSEALYSFFNGDRVGFIGDVGIIDFSKYFPTLLGGAIITRNESLSEYIKNQLNRNKQWGNNFILFAKYYYVKTRRKKIKSFFKNLYAMSKNIYDLNYRIHPIVEKIISNEIFHNNREKREKNKIYFWKKLMNLNLLNGANDIKDITPFVLPIITSNNKLIRIQKELSNIGVNTSIKNFDVNRNMFNPNFVKCCPIPLHGGVDHNYRRKIMTAIKKGIDL